MRESIADKARRYLVEGRLIVEETSAFGPVEARCRGAGRTWRPGWSPSKGWRCDCPAVRNCAHLEALRLVVAVLEPPHLLDDSRFPPPARGATVVMLRCWYWTACLVDRLAVAAARWSRR